MSITLRTLAFQFCSFLLLSSCAPLRPVEFRSINDFKVEHLTSQPAVSINLNLHNPNSFGCTLKDFNLNFLLSETQLANVKLERNRLPANSDFTIPISSQVSYDQLVKFLPAGIENFSGGKEIPVAFRGELTLKKFIFRKKFPFEFNTSINTKNIKLH